MGACTSRARQALRVPAEVPTHGWELAWQARLIAPGRAERGLDPFGRVAIDAVVGTTASTHHSRQTGQERSGGNIPHRRC